jgi:hypothetical protein
MCVTLYQDKWHRDSHTEKISVLFLQIPHTVGIMALQWVVLINYTRYQFCDTFDV